MTPFWDWEVPLMLWLQQGHPLWTPFFSFLTFLGNEEFSLLAGPLVLWCINKTWGIGLFILLLGSQSFNVAIKEWLRVPRPFLAHPEILQLDHPGGWSFPSGHAQNNTVIWLYLASLVRRVWFWIVAGALIAGIIISRPYLGVHYPSDVLAGAVIGVVFLIVCLAAAPRVTAWVVSHDTTLWLAGFVMIGILVCVIQPYPDFIAAFATLWCGMLGLIMERSQVRFAVDGPAGQRALRYLLGLIGILLLWRGLKLVFEPLAAENTALYLMLRGIRYSALGLWVTYGAPALFVRLKLAPQAPLPEIQPTT